MSNAVDHPAPGASPGCFAASGLGKLYRSGTAEVHALRGVDLMIAGGEVLAPYGGTGAHGRADHVSHAFIDNEQHQLDAMTRVIPPVFLMVALFLVAIVMSRMIRTERGQIGLLKAFGSSDWAVAAHYLKFAAVIALLATLLGAAVGVWMGREMAQLYGEYHHFPFLDCIVSPPLILAAGALSMVTVGLGAVAGVRSVVRLHPAVAMSAPPPPLYRAGAVERLGRRMGLSAIGHINDEHGEVLAGLSEGQSVVLNPGSLVANETRVKPR